MQLGQPRVVAGHAPREEMLGETIRGQDQRIVRIGLGGDMVEGIGDDHRQRGHLLPDDPVGDGRFQRLVINRERPVREAEGRVQPAPPVKMDSKGLGPGDGVQLPASGRGLVGRRLCDFKMGDIRPNPAPQGRVPYQKLLAFRPRPALGIG